MIALKSERQAALLLVVSVIVLLLVVNAIDVRLLWFKFDPGRRATSPNWCTKARTCSS
jgi:hypothetical protein